MTTTPTTPIPNLIPSSPDPNQLNLLDKIIQKTKEQKIRWDKLKSGYVAQVLSGPDRLKLEFTTTQDRDNWTKFLVQTGEGTVLTVDGTVNAFVLRLAGLHSDPATAKTSELFALVSRLSEGSVERAINALDRL